MSLKKEKKEYRAKIRSDEDFDELAQIWPGKDDNPDYPYNAKGIRSIGGDLKDGDKVVAQTIRFSRDKKYDWNEKTVRSWLKENGYAKELEVSKIKNAWMPNLVQRELTGDIFYIESDIEIIKKLEYKEGKDLIIQGIINSDSIDTYNEIVAPEAVMESVPFYMKFPTVRFMHMGEPIGETLKIWKKKNLVRAKMRIDAVKVDIIKQILSGTLKAFSIGFKPLKLEQFCPQENKCYWKYVKLLLIEISLVDSPANRDAIKESITWKALLDKSEFASLKQRSLDYRTTHISDDDITPPEGANLEEDDEDEPTSEEDKSNSNGVKIRTKSLIKLKDSDDTNKAKNSLNDTRGVKMPKDAEGNEIVEDVEGTVLDDASTEPTTGTVVDDTVVEETETEKSLKAILKGIDDINAKVDTNAGAIEKMQMSEDEKKAAEVIEVRAAEISKVKDEEIVKKDAELAEMKTALAVQKALFENLPAQAKKGLDPNGNPEDGNALSDDYPGMKVTNKQAKAWKETEDLLLKYCN